MAVSIMPDAINFNPTPLMKATNAPIATLSATCPSLRLPASSPMNAPMNGNIIMPHGGRMKIPSTMPMKVPTVAGREPPYLRVIHTGRKLSARVTTIVTTSHTINTHKGISEYFVKYINSRPTQLIGGPGSTGITEPINPMTPSSIATIAKKIDKI